MKRFLHQLFDYNFYCNKKLLEQFAKMENVPDTCHKLFDHILNTHHIWNQHILENTPEFGVWQRHEINDWEDLHYENQRTTFEIITNAEDFNRRVGYVNNEGRTHANDLNDILFHIINHATHHRGQILMDMRASDVEPYPMDYIFYKR